MSFENTDCPCGGKKDRDTMLCRICEVELAGHPSMISFNNTKASLETRRHAALVLLTLVRGRHAKRKP